MAKLRVHGFTVSVDGYGAGPHQDKKNPLGVGGEDLHQWMVTTRTFQQMQGKKDTGRTGVDDDFTARGMEGIGAWILGRNMFAPSRGPWPDDGWKGWWGKNPPYHAPTFVLTHYARPPLEMEGGTIFHFVTEGIRPALERAIDAAGGQDVRLVGGVATVRQYLTVRLIDEMHLAIAPLLLGSGESLWAGVDINELGYECATHTETELATHLVITKRA